MGKRGPKPRFLDVACPNEQCSQFGITGEGNVTIYAVSIKLKQFKYNYYFMAYIDNREWPEYNAKLVRRGEFYLDLSCVKNWSWELREMNRKKTGAPYKYPDTFITFPSIIYSFLRLPYRQLEGFIGRLSTYEPGLVAADYTTLHKRISKQKLEIILY